MLAGCGAGEKITDQLVLSITKVAAGRPIHGTLVVDNPGGPIDLTKLASIELHPGKPGSARLTGCRPEVAVGLSNRQVSQRPAFDLSCSPQPFLIAHGTTRIEVTALTTYLGCLQPGGSSSQPGTPACLNGNQVPPLPAGRYQASVVWSETVPLPRPRSVTVTLTR